ncbi:ATP-binding cassette domain-containing protein [Chitinophaga pendula]|uniref:ATP-binding cassette domain-containing protein n=1 Tax=Chitinophaga TaxID=79328 RepID=UPI000BAF1192|nr:MULTISPECIES: ATP-binding cassette domain-containing protein [Chitinophaga]ASZ09833.1 ABC transporter [Chitinophaga sp. MD30]UCJ07225.1 ATP-binding cassette domain-containing protein [Chitinophaga pendula]
MKHAEAIPFLSLEHITVRYLDKTLFQQLDWRILQGEQWAITGSSGSGKTALLNAIAGKFNIINGGIRYHFYDTYREQHTITDPYFNYRNLLTLVAHHHHFRNKSNTTEFYYQQRFNSSDAGDAPTVQSYLFGEDKVATAAEEALVAPLRITPLLHKELIKLSNGETRRVMIAHALLQRPVLLLLDNPFIGLDVNARKDFTAMIDQLIANGLTILLVTSPHEIPSLVTHVLTLDNGAITGKYTREEFDALPKVLQEQSADTSHMAALLPGLLASANNASYHTIVQMEDVQVKYGNAHILNGINWTIRANEKWALLGPNGAGKSTLLSLINADNPQAYANRITLFDRRRGSGESIWDIKRKIGFISPELHQYFTSRDTCLQVAASGFHDIIGRSGKTTPEQLATAEQWLEVLAIQSYAQEPFKQVPESIQRLALLARALVKQPPLLIFDEPCQGLDAQQKLHFKQVIEALCEHMEVTLIFVTHYTEELPACVDHFLRLEKGQVVS